MEKEKHIYGHLVMVRNGTNCQNIYENISKAENFILERCQEENCQCHL